MARIYRFTISGDFAGGAQELAHTWHYQTDNSVGASEPSADDVLDQIQSLWGDTSDWQFIRAVAPTSVTYRRAEILEQLPPGSTAAPHGAVKVFALAGTLGASGDRVPDPLCAYFNSGTDVRGRSFRGGMHGPPLLNAGPLSTDGEFNTASSYWTLLTTLANALKDSGTITELVGTSDVNPVVYSRTRHARGLDPATRITSVTQSRRVRFLRTRDPGR